jgi:ankyrin repeat protein
MMEALYGQEDAIEGQQAAARVAKMREVDPCAVIACRLQEGVAVVACYDLSLRGNAEWGVPTALALIASASTARDVAPVCDTDTADDVIRAASEFVRETPFNLRTLDLRCAQLSAAEVDRITSALGDAPRHGYVQTVGLAANNSVKADNVLALKAALCGCRRLRKLTVTHTGRFMAWPALLADADVAPRAVTIHGAALTPLMAAVARGRGLALRRLLASPQLDLGAAVGRGTTALHIAARMDHAEAAGMLVAAGANRELRDSHNSTPLLVAAYHGSEAVLRVLLAAGCAKDAVNDNQWSAVHLAAFNGHYPVMQALLDARCNLELRTAKGSTPLQAAAKVKAPHMALVQLLLSAGADFDTRDNDGKTMLYYASRDGDVALLRLFIAAGADPTTISGNGYLPIGMAAHNGHDTCVRLLVARLKQLGDTTHVEAVDGDGDTPLWCAITRNQEACARELLVGGASSTGGKGGMTYIDRAREKKNFGIFKLLLEAGADFTGGLASACSDNDEIATYVVTQLTKHFAGDELRAKLEEANGDSWTPLGAAAAAGHEAVAALLVDSGCSLGVICHGKTPLFHAVANGHTAVVRLITARMNRGRANRVGDGAASVNERSATGATALHLAAELGHAAIVSVLIDAGSDATAVDDNDETAAAGATSDTVRFRIRAAAGDTAGWLNDQDRDGETMLYRCAGRGDIDTVRALIDIGADALLRSNHHVTPLMVAGHSGHKDIVALLLAHLAKLGDTTHVDARDKDGDTALRNTAEKGHIVCLKLLMDAGADPSVVNAAGDDAFQGASKRATFVLQNGSAAARQTVDDRDSEGKTMLYLAAKEGATAFVDMLLQGGADATLISNNNYSAIGMAAYNGHTECVALIAARLTALGDTTAIEFVDGDGDSPVWNAIMKDRTECVRALLAGGASATAAKKGTSYVSKAMAIGDGVARSAIVRLLVEAGADLSHGAPLVAAVGMTGDILRVMLRELASRALSLAVINLKNADGETALRRAAAIGDGDDIEQLVAAGADPSIGRHSRDSAWGVASNDEHRQLLLAGLADGRTVGNTACRDAARNLTPLLFAFNAHDVPSVAGLLAAGFNAFDPAGPLPSASVGVRAARDPEHEDTLNAIVAHDGVTQVALIDAVGADGWSLLGAAAHANCTAHVALLVAAGADVRVACHDQTVLHHAARHGNADVIAIVVSKLQDPALDADILLGHTFVGKTALVVAEDHNQAHAAAALRAARADAHPR